MANIEAVTKKEYTSSSGQTAYNDHGIAFLHKDDIEVWITDSASDYGAGIPVLQQTTASATDPLTSSHPQVAGTRRPALTTATRQRGYTLSTDGTDISLKAAPTAGSTVTIQRTTRDGSGKYTTFTSGSTIRHTDLNQAFDEVRYQVQEARNGIMGQSAGQAAGDNIDAASLVGNLPVLDGSNLTGVIVGDSSITSAKITDGAIVNADINNSAAIALSKLGTGTLPSGITIASANIPTGTIIADDLSTDSVTTAKIKDGEVSTSKIATGALDGRYYTETELDAGQLDNRYYTETELNAGQLDNRYYTETESDARYYNISSTEEIVSGETWVGDDAKVATTKAIDNRVVDLIDDVGGFVALTNEAAIPADHPEKANETTADRIGTIISIGVLSATYTPSGGTCTIPSGTLTNHSVNATITDCGSTTLSAGFGVLVETTAQTDAQYAAGPAFKFHRLTPKATEVTTVAGKATEITTCHTKATEITTVAGIDTEVTAVAGKATEIGRLGTTDAVADMALLGTTDCVADMAILGTSDVVADLNTLATSDIVSDLDTVASNITDVSNFADLYQIASSSPSTDGGGNSLAAGDLWFDSSSNKALKVHTGTAFAAVSPTQAVLDDIAIVSGDLTRQEDLGNVSDALASATTTSDLATCADNITNINTFANVYRISANAPSSSLDEGDLWYDSTANKLKYYTGSAWTVTAGAGLSAVADDTSPELAGHLDCNDKNLTEVATVSGDNLQIDFGSIA